MTDESVNVPQAMDETQVVTPKHAMVQREGFMVPLIGIPAESVLEECDLCHNQVDMSTITYNGPQMLCQKCAANPGGDQPVFVEINPTSLDNEKDKLFAEAISTFVVEDRASESAATPPADCAPEPVSTPQEPATPPAPAKRRRGRQPVVDEISSLPISRQRKKQMRWKRDGKCILCGGKLAKMTLKGEERVNKNFCAKHRRAAQKRDKARKRAIAKKALTQSPTAP